MEFTNTQIQQFTVGALTITEDENGYSFGRFTADQRAAFGAVFDKWAERSDFTSGIHIDFHTDATNLQVVVAAEGTYEVLIDDLGSYCELLSKNDVINLDLDGADHRITILLPYHAPGKIRAVTLNGESYVQPHSYKKKIAFYGDSITQGSFASRSSQTYSWLLTRYFDLHSMNFGVGGIRFQPESVIDVGYDPDVVIISLGTNNFGSNKPAELLHTNCPAFFDNISALYPNSKIVCITPIWRADGEELRAVGTIHDTRAYIQAEAEKRNFIVVDGFKLVPHRIEYFEDLRLHPNDIGFAFYAQNLIKAIGQYF